MNQSGEAPQERWYSRIVHRWYLLVFWAAAAAFGVVAVLVAVPTQYQASGQLLLLPPAQPLAEGERRNTYMFLPDGLVLTAILVANTVNTPDVARELTDAGFTSTYTVGVVPGTGPLITITVKDVDPTQALALRDELLDRLEAEIRRIQAAEDVPTSQLMEPRRFSASTQAEQLGGSRIRAMLAVVVVGVVLAALSFKEVERRSSRRVAAAVESPQPQPQPQPQPAPSQPQPVVTQTVTAQGSQNNELDGLLSLLANLPSPQPGGSEPRDQGPPPGAPQVSNGYANGNGNNVHSPPSPPRTMPAADPWGTLGTAVARPQAPLPPGKPPDHPHLQS